MNSRCTSSLSLCHTSRRCAASDCILRMASASARASSASRSPPASASLPASAADRSASASPQASGDRLRERRRPRGLRLRGLRVRVPVSDRPRVPGSVTVDRRRRVSAAVLADVSCSVNDLSAVPQSFSPARMSRRASTESSSERRFQRSSWRWHRLSWCWTSMPSERNAATSTGVATADAARVRAVGEPTPTLAAEVGQRERDVVKELRPPAPPEAAWTGGGGVALRGRAGDADVGRLRPVAATPCSGDDVAAGDIVPTLGSGENAADAAAATEASVAADTTRERRGRAALASTAQRGLAPADSPPAATDACNSSLPFSAFSARLAMRSARALAMACTHSPFSRDDSAHSTSSRSPSHSTKALVSSTTSRVGSIFARSLRKPMWKSFSRFVVRPPAPSSRSSGLGSSRVMLASAKTALGACDCTPMSSQYCRRSGSRTKARRCHARVQSPCFQSQPDLRRCARSTRASAARCADSTDRESAGGEGCRLAAIFRVYVHLYIRSRCVCRCRLLCARATVS